MRRAFFITVLAFSLSACGGSGNSGNAAEATDDAIVQAERAEAQQAETNKDCEGKDAGDSSICKEMADGAATDVEAQ